MISHIHMQKPVFIDEMPNNTDETGYYLFPDGFLIAFGVAPIEFSTTTQQTIVTIPIAIKSRYWTYASAYVEEIGVNSRVRVAADAGENMVAIYSKLITGSTTTLNVRWFAFGTWK